MNETLSQKRCRFSHDISLLVIAAKSMGFDVAYNEVLRKQAQADANAASGAGIANSLHLLGLAGDLLLYKDGTYLSTVVDYRPLGDYWKTLGTDHMWGGDFMGKDAAGNVVSKPDADHFSIEHNGVK
jgi:hypothetical protein